MKTYDLLQTLERILSSKTDKQLGISSDPSNNSIQSKRIMSQVCQAPDTFDFEFKLFNIPKSRQPKSDRVAFSRLYTLFDYLNKRMQLQHYESVVQIATTSKSLIELLGYKMAVKRTIDLAIQMGLLAPYTESYHYGSHNKLSNYAKTYVLNKFIYKIFIEYCKDNDISIMKEYKRNISYNTVIHYGNKLNLDDFRISSKLRIKNVDNLPKAEFEQFAIQTMKDNYNKKWNNVYTWTENKINECRSFNFYKKNPNFAPIFRPNVKWQANGNKVVTKISVRATNSCVAAKKTKDPNDVKGIIYRDDIRQQFGLLYEHDVTASVPTNTYLINYGKWLDDVDFYELFWKELQKLDSSLVNVDFTPEIRNALKRLFMTIRFDKDKLMGTHIANRVALHKSHKDYNAYDWRKELPELMKLLKQAVVNVIGEFNDSEIFFIESAIYADVTAKLLKKGIKVFQCYDCWYTDKEVDIASIVKESAEAFYSKFINSSTSNEDNTESNINTDNNNNTYNTYNTNINNMYYNTVIHYGNKLMNRKKLE